MAGDTIKGDNSGNILVEFDYNNIILVDPNKTIDSKGKVSERLVDHENLVMYANLEAELLPRTKLAVGTTSSDIEIVSIAKINFLKPNKGDSFTTQYYDEITGKDSIVGKGINQTNAEYVPPSNGQKSYEKRTITSNGQEGSIDTGLLGITSINVQISGSFIPKVTISLEDVQGRALFQLGEKSPYAAFFHMPYPPFYLTLKGYYGQAIRYMLNLTKFNARYNSGGGNYAVELEFVGYKFNILNEITMGSLVALPYMYNTTFDISNSNVGEKPSEALQTTVQQQGGDVNNANNSNTSVTKQIFTSKGYQKMKEVYREYKVKKIIEDDFPELTLVQLMNKLEMFEQTIINYYLNNKSDVEPLTNIRVYTETLKSLYEQIYSETNSWKSNYLEPQPFFGKDGTIYYAYKETIPDNEEPTLLSKLDAIVTSANKTLNENKTLGKGAPSEIKNKISLPIFTAITTPDKIDWKKTTEVHFQTPNANVRQVNELILKYKKLFKPATVGSVPNVINSIITAGSTPTTFTNDVNKAPTIEIIKPYFFVFDGSDRFIKIVQDMISQANKKLSEVEKKLTEELKQKIEDKNTGIGFAPTVRNILAVILASTEGFIRLLDDVHTKAWDVKYDPVRKKAILDNDKGPVNTETKEVVPNIIENPSNQTVLQKPVYPWPQLFVEVIKDGVNKYELKYPGDPSIINVTEGYRYDKWPEVEFIEEFIKGMATLSSQLASSPDLDVVEYTNILNINPIEYPLSGITYANTEEIKYFYEIWERQFLTSRYNNFARFADSTTAQELIKTISEVDTKNIINTLGRSNPFLNQKLKNFTYNAQTYLSFLQSINGGNSGAWVDYFIKDKFVTPYISQITSVLANELLSIKNIGKLSSESLDTQGLKSLLTNSLNDPLIIDTYPFTDTNWTSKNLIDADKNKGNTIYNTTKTLGLQENFDLISNFVNINDYETNRPVTNFSYFEVQNPLITSTNVSNQSTFLNNLYFNRRPINFIPTEGYCFFKTPKNATSTNITTISDNLPYRTTTSILNTPFFINAILEGVSLEKNKSPHPYVAAAYLFLNSLPLISLREKLKTKGKGLNDLDYMFASLKKFGAIHKLPYAWVLKIGSLWHRYKIQITEQRDIISSSVWNNLDYKDCFDPIGKSVSRKYVLDFNGKTGNTIQLETITQGAVAVQSGFFPKIINDFNYFLNGISIYTNYTDAEIQTSINNGLKIHNFPESNLTLNEIVPPQPNPISSTYYTWSILTPTTDGHFVIPSFGSKQNQVVPSLITNNTFATSDKIIGNNSVYNGSARLLWAAPNYGYFDTTQIRKPSTESHMNFINGSSDELSPFQLLNNADVNNYSKIEELFGVFDRNMLDTFEENFLSFARPAISAKSTPTTTTDFFVQVSSDDISFRNFQALFRVLMKVDNPTTNEANSAYFERVIGEQLNTFSSKIKTFLEYDVILKFGNPSFYDRYYFDSYLKHTNAATPQNGASYLSFPQLFAPFQPTSLPLQNTSNLKAFDSLRLNVGFSTIPSMSYGVNNSYITDFFVFSKIEFTEENVKKLAPLIKMYATQKLKNSSLTITQFTTEISKYFEVCNDIRDNSLNFILSRIQKELPNYSETPEKTVDSKLQGDQTKFTLYDYYKSINDKWISGGDFKTKTFFEDFLFLDKASRDIGGSLYIDIFELKRILNKESFNQDMSVYTFFASILYDNKFVIMNLPAYVNFYNVQDVTGVDRRKPEGSLEFADKLWGTFLNLDYRDSSPKIVCFFTGKPSNYADLPESKNFLFKNDGIQFEKQDGVLGDKLDGKTNYAFSNRVVGFNVDIGIRNQNVFSQFQVSQDEGKGTTESVTVLHDMIKRAGGREASTQNVSLYNYYLNRSYGCQVVSMGNALIQPTMYFNLRHVPMFNGSYLITDVSHVITPGNFETTFKGTRQGVYDLPSIDDYLQTINQNLLTQIEAIIKNQNEKESKENTTTNNTEKSSEVSQDAETKPSPEGSCKTTPDYSKKSYLPTTAKVTPLSIKELYDKIKSKVDIEKKTNPERDTLTSIIFVICYIKTFKNGEFVGYNNNFATVETLDTYLTTLNLSNFAEKAYSCVSVKTLKDRSSVPILNFKNPELFISFMVSRLEEPNKMKSIAEQIGIHQFYITEWSTPTISIENFNTNRDTVYQESKQRIYEAVRELEKLGTKVTNVEQFVNGKNYQKIYPTPTPSKPPLVVSPNASILRVENVGQGQTKISLSIFPNVGKWKISGVTYSVTSSRNCTPNLKGGIRNTDENWFLTPLEDINTSCSGSSPGTYSVIYDIVVVPVDNNGNSDPSRQTKFDRRTVTITI